MTIKSKRKVKGLKYKSIIDTNMTGTVRNQVNIWQNKIAKEKGISYMRKAKKIKKRK